MTYDYTIKNECITVVIKDTTADRFLDELCAKMGCDALYSLQSDVAKEAIEEMAMEYILEERPVVGYWNSDDVETVNYLEVKIHCGRIKTEFDFYGDVAGIRYNQIERGAYA